MEKFMTIEEIVKSKIRTIENFPKEGILFRDITTAIKDKETLPLIIDYLCDQFKGLKIDYIAGIESRGFIFGMPMAYKLGCGFVPVRKPNKLPAETIAQEYKLEYGTDKIEIHKDAFGVGDNVLIVDDLLATGGTAEAAAKLVKKTGANLVGMGFLIELQALKGRDKLNNCGEIISMLKY
jgi:adenine phosphoribosyltransferase